MPDSCPRSWGRVRLSKSIEPSPLAGALWARRLGLFAIPVTLIAGAMTRFDMVEAASGLAAVGAGIALALLAVCLATAALIRIWNRGDAGAGPAAIGLLAGLLVIAWPVLTVGLAFAKPALNDVTTSPGDPPLFDLAISDRRPGDNPGRYPGDAAALVQIAAYPELRSLEVPVQPREAHELALKLVEERGWRLLGQRAPIGNVEGRVEAVARSLLLGFRDDVVVRIRRAPRGSVVDMRSASRIGRHDFGANAERIRAFLDDLETRARELSLEAG